MSPIRFSHALDTTIPVYSVALAAGFTDDAWLRAVYALRRWIDPRSGPNEGRVYVDEAVQIVNERLERSLRQDFLSALRTQKNAHLRAMGWTGSQISQNGFSTVDGQLVAIQLVEDGPGAH